MLTLDQCSAQGREAPCGWCKFCNYLNKSTLHYSIFNYVMIYPINLFAQSIFDGSQEIVKVVVVVVVVVCLFPAQSYKHYKNKTWYITTNNYAGGHQRSQWLIVLAAVILEINVVLQPVLATVRARISCGLWEMCG